MKHRWDPKPEDAISLAAIRWFACTLESMAIEIYATDRTAFGDIEGVLKKAVEGLGGVKVKRPANAEDCPDGYEFCNGLCRPSCFGETPPVRPKAARRPTKKR